MIAFFRDSLAPPELCRLLYLTVPKELHVPVVFHNRPTAFVDQGALATCWGDQIHINLNKVWDADCWNPFKRGGMTFRIWKLLLETCYHEFGHVATWEEVDLGFDTPWPRARIRERLADSWMDERIALLLQHDPRLCQPRKIKGFLGLRIAEQMEYLENAKVSFEHGARRGGGIHHYVKEVRCRRSGGQLSAGDVLEHLRLRGFGYRQLRRTCADIGVDYTDSAGRCHRLYTWGDLQVLQRRLSGSKRWPWMPDARYYINAAMSKVG